MIELFSRCVCKKCNTQFVVDSRFAPRIDSHVSSQQCKLSVKDDPKYKERIDWDHSDKHAQCKICMSVFSKTANIASNIVQHFKSNLKCSTQNIPVNKTGKISSFFVKQKVKSSAPLPESAPLPGLRRCIHCQMTLQENNVFDVCSLCAKTTAMSAKVKMLFNTITKTVRPSPYTNNKYLSHEDIIQKLKYVQAQLNNAKRRDTIYESKQIEIVDKTDKKLSQSFEIVSKTKDPNHLKVLDIMSDQLKYCALQIEGVALQGMRWSKSSLDLHTALRLTGGPRINKFLTLNSGGPAKRTLDREIKEGRMNFEMNKVSESNLNHVLKIYKHIIKQNPKKILDKSIILNIGFDETGVTPCWSWNENTDCIEGSCGFKHPDHPCDFNFQFKVGESLQDFENLLKFSKNAVKSSYLMSIIMVPLHPFLPCLPVGLYSVCNKFNTLAALKDWQSWLSLIQSSCDFFNVVVFAC